MEEFNKFKFLFDISAAGVPNLAYVETVDDEKVNVLVSSRFVLGDKENIFSMFIQVNECKITNKNVNFT